MTTGGIKREDIVQVDIKGDRFYAFVTGPGPKRTIAVRAVCRPAIRRNVTARQIIGHYRKRKGSA